MPSSACKKIHAGRERALRYAAADEQPAEDQRGSHRRRERVDQREGAKRDEHQTQDEMEPPMTLDFHQFLPRTLRIDLPPTFVQNAPRTGSRWGKSRHSRTPWMRTQATRALQTVCRRIQERFFV